jgi:hypothetical protein
MATVLPWWQPLKFPKRFVRLAFVAYKKGRLSKGKLAEMLDTSLIDLSKTPRNMTIKTKKVMRLKCVLVVTYSILVLQV